VNFVALQMKVPAGDLGFYEWSGSTIEYHRAQIRQHLGYRECGVTDAERLTAWLVEHVTQAERRPDRVREELLDRCRAERVEPPAKGRLDRIVRSALRLGEETLTRRGLRSTQPSCEGDDPGSSPRSWCVKRSPHDPVSVTLSGQCWWCRGVCRFLGVLVVGGGDAGPGQDVEAEVAAVFDPVVVLLGQDGADEADQGVAGLGRCPRRRSCGGSLG